jgi:tRNA G10  N-methylase Trm11
MMINLSGANADSILLDPFCGSGTIITEAMILGYKNLIGADASERAIADTKTNIDWIIQHYSLSTNSPKIFQSDARNLNEKITNNSVDTIVTEPFLGKPLKGNETFEEIKSQSTELKRLYLGAFEQFQKILKLKGTIIFIIPCFKYKGDWLKIDCLPEIKKLGFTPVSMWEDKNFLLYSRPDQHVGREIWKFIKE